MYFWLMPSHNYFLFNLKIFNNFYHLKYLNVIANVFHTKDSTNLNENLQNKNVEALLKYAAPTIGVFYKQVKAENKRNPKKNYNIFEKQ